MPPLLDVEGLRVTVPTPIGPALALRGVDLTLERGETLGLVGESGCGKSMTALAIMNLLPDGARRQATRLALSGEDLTQRSERGMRDLRGRRIGMVFQDPGTALNPVQPIGTQLVSVRRRHFDDDRRQATDRAVALLERVGISGAGRRLGQYPHELSGGLKQRVMIAMALIGEPSLLLADEPTTALDVTVQARVLHLLRGLQRELGIGILLITHDLGVVAAVADRAAVMYAGEIVETGPVGTVLDRPAHPYSRRLISCVPDTGLRARLATIPGQVPPATALPNGCGFAPRCTLALETCRAGAIPIQRVAGHWARCIRAGEVVAGHA